jgi:hypothetical protein
MSNDLDLDCDYEFWIQGDVLAVERRRLVAPERSAAASGSPASLSLSASKTPPGVKDPPHDQYLVAAVYRYTRSDNDLTNPGMGYGELTQEAAWETTSTGLHLRKFYVRRTRSARKRFPHEEPSEASTKHVISILPPPLKP